MTGAVRPRARPLWRKIARRAAKLWLRWRYRGFDPGARPDRRVKVAGLHLRVLRGVFDPSIHFTSGALAEWLKRPGIVKPGALVLDVGTGSGILSVAAALAGAGPIVALDADASAVECARLNARRYGLAGQISVRRSEFFAAVIGEKFDLVLVNPPYLRGDAPSAAHRAYMAGRSLEWIRRFAHELPRVLSPRGSALMVLGDAAELDAILRVLLDEGLDVRESGWSEFLAETVYFFELRPTAQAQVIA